MKRATAIIEDEQVTRDSVMAILSAMGYETAGFNDAKHFLESLSGGATYDLCIVDITLPGMRGDDMLVEAATCGKIRNAVILFLSGLQESERETARRKVSGHFPRVDYTCKPVRAERLLAHINTLMKIGARS